MQLLNINSIIKKYISFNNRKPCAKWGLCLSVSLFLFVTAPVQGQIYIGADAVMSGMKYLLVMPDKDGYSNDVINTPYRGIDMPPCTAGDSGKKFAKVYHKVFRPGNRQNCLFGSALMFSAAAFSAAQHEIPKQYFTVRKSCCHATTACRFVSPPQNSGDNLIACALQAHLFQQGNLSPPIAR
ncbi:MAG: hypothetical protein LBS01_01275 [Prevotellaceae bacterium]|jgi:hypothetical protein|nr:hypothetical protein [Prevotellaceae bacterium]